MRSTISYKTITKENGGLKKIPIYSYVVVICEVDGDQVKAVRYDGYERKGDLHRQAEADYPGWKMKLVNRLYDEDFEK